MKKRFCLFLAILLLFVASCGPKTPAGGETGTGGSKTETVNLFGGEEDYRIVVPANATSIQTRLSARLADAVSAVTGKTPTRVTDDTAKYPEQKKEILLGATARKASEDAVAELGDSEWRIAFAGDKLLLTASNDAMLAKAVETLTDTWSAADGSISIARTDLSASGGDDILTLTKSGRFTCPVIVDDGVAADTRTKLAELFDSLREDLGMGRITLTLDNASEDEAGKTEILIGATNRAASRAAMNTLTAPSYRIAAADGKIAVVATDDERLYNAVRAFCEMLRQAKKGTLKGDLCFGEVYTVTENNGFDGKKWLATVPTFEAGALTGGYNENAVSCMMVYDGTEQSDYEGYLAQLTKAGFTETRAETLGGNRYALYSGESATVYVSFSAQSGRTRIGAEQKGASITPERAPETETGTPRLWQLEIDNRNSKLNGGMSYVFRGTNGEFFILDGGYNTETEADRIYTLLRENTPAGQTPVIAGWYISHLHGDHYGAMLAFSEKYASEVPVRAFYYHFSQRSGDAQWLTDIKKSVDTAMGRWKDAVRYGNLHTGLGFTVAGIRVDVLYTQEDLLPTLTEDLNETGTVIRVTAGGQRILFLADMGKLVADRMLADLPAEELKSDIVQVAHHGYEGASLAFYQVVNPETVLWPMNIIGWQETGYASIPQNVFAFWYRMSPTDKYPFGNRWLVDSESVKKIIVSGFGTAEISLPYAPSGEKLGDFNDYFNKHKA
ncbi:MAG TPA: hypothetical protein DDW30_06560 [Clostridiales bacterium]|nr:hypothetical protein [Clostridiales bacterium]